MIRGRALIVARTIWPWLGLIALIAVLHWFLADWVSAVVFLIIPVVAAAWFAERRIGLAVAVLAAATGAAVQIFDGQVSTTAELVSEGVARLFVYGLVAHLVSRQCRLLRQQRRLAAIDPLTGALNRGAFFDRVEAELALARRHGREVSLIYLDVDDLKMINDAEGHQAGDLHLAALVRTAGKSLRRSDVIGRLGGDEFAVLLPETDEDEAEKLADRLRAALLDDRERDPIYASMGLVSYRQAPGNTDTLLRRADALMYIAKRSGSGLAKEHHGDDTIRRRT
jgi:diguanylate cyclase (GGDEF)-like protein